MTVDQIEKLLLVYFVGINIISYFMMWRDKRASINKARRISEVKLLTIALMLGSLGIWLGMKKPLYHKAAKPKFTIGIPMIMVLQLVVVGYLLYQYTK